jgi:hypothetical protein
MIGLLKRWDFWFGLLGALGLLFAIYTYVSTKKVGRISYSYDTQKVFDPANLSGFTLVTPDKNPVQQPVYATEVVIWNSGDLSLSDNSDRVREPLEVGVNGVIYYDLISRINLVEPDNFNIAFSQDRGNITISWKYFDPGQGIRLTLLHSSRGDPKITFMGRFFETTLREEPHSAVKKKDDIPSFILYCGISAIIVAIVMLLLLQKLAGRLAKSQADKPNLITGHSLIRRIGVSRALTFFSLLLGAEGTLIVAMYTYLVYFTSTPPV